MNDEILGIRKELRFFKVYTLVSTALLAVLWFSGFRQTDEKQRFKEIDVERLNIVQADGKYCFVLTNGNRAPGAIIGGKEIRRSNSNNTPSILFYNEEGDENGGLVSAGKKEADGTFYAATRLVFDRFRRDEMLSLQYYEDDGGGYSGLQLQDTRDISSSEFLEGNDSIRAMPDGPAKTEALKKFRTAANTGAGRLFIGKNKSKAIIVNLRDKSGQSRLRLQVDSLGSPRMDFLDANGNITSSLPDSAKVASKK